MNQLKNAKNHIMTSVQEHITKNCAHHFFHALGQTWKMIGMERENFSLRGMEKCKNPHMQRRPDIPCAYE
jgi:hypothetical protein